MKPEISIGVALGVAAIVGAVYVNATPTLTDARVAPVGNDDLDAARKMAAWTSAGIVGAVSLIAKDATVFILGGAMIITLDWWYRHANEVDPRVGKATVRAAMVNAGAPTQMTDGDAYGYHDDASDVSLGF